MTSGWAVTAPIRLQGKSVSSYAVGSGTGMYLILLSAGRGGKALPSHASSMHPEQEHHICGVLVGCCSSHSSVLNALLPYILGCAQRMRGGHPTTGLPREDRAVWVAPGHIPAAGLAHVAAVKPPQ